MGSGSAEKELIVESTRGVARFDRDGDFDIAVSNLDAPRPGCAEREGWRARVSMA